MAIPAKRFKFLDEETNVGFSDFLKEDNKSILNSPINELKEISSNVENFLKTSSQKFLKSNIDSAVSGIKERIPKGLSNGLKDLSNLNTREVDQFISDMMPDMSIAQSVVNRLPKDLKDKALSYVSGDNKLYETLSGRLDDSAVTKTVGELLNRVSNGSIDIPSINKNDILSNLTMLSNLGSEVNIPEVFNKLSATIDDPNLISRASGIVLNNLSHSKNINAVLEIANEAQGLVTKLENPNVSSLLLDSLSGLKVKDNELSKTYDKVINGLTSLDSLWNEPISGTNISAASLLNKPKITDIVKSKVMDTVLVDLDAIPDTDEVFLSLVV